MNIAESKVVRCWTSQNVPSMNYGRELSRMEYTPQQTQTVVDITRILYTLCPNKSPSVILEAAYSMVDTLRANRLVV